MPGNLPQAVTEFLDRHHVMTLATQGPHGPWAAAVHDECEDWQHIKGLQLEGRVHALGPEAVVRARERYAERFPVTGPSSLAPAAIREALLRVRWYAFVPQRVVHLDNGRGFGHREVFQDITAG